MSTRVMTNPGPRQQRADCIVIIVSFGSAQPLCACSLIGHAAAIQEYYEAELAKVLATTGHRYTLSCVKLTSAPLPESRPRLWWLGSRDPGLTADVWKLAVEDIEKHAKALPQQHLSAFFARSTGEGFREPDKDATWDREAQYHQIFAKAMSDAIKNKRLEKTTKPKPMNERVSACNASLQTSSPTVRAMADVYEVIVDKQVQDVQASDPGLAAKITTRAADIGQSAHRGHIALSGTWGTLCTSSNIFDYNSGKFLSAREMLAMLGFDGRSCWVAIKRAS